jgi:hypothetical protein
VVLAELHAADKLDWSKAAIDGSHIRAVEGGCVSSSTSVASPPSDESTSALTRSLRWFWIAAAVGRPT